MYNLNYIFVDYRRKWTQRLLRMKNIRIPKLVYEYIELAEGIQNDQGKMERTTPLKPCRLIHCGLLLLLLLL